MLEVIYQPVTVAAPGVQVNQVAGGSFAGDQLNYYSESSDFHTPDLARAASPFFCSEVVAEWLVAELSSRRLLVLGGPVLREKVELARHLAWRAKGRLPLSHSGEAPLEIEVVEALPGGNRLRMVAEFEQRTEPTIFLLGDVEPYHVGHDLVRLHRQVEASPHFLLLSTDKTREAWGIVGAHPAREVWKELSGRDVYPPAELAKFLRHQLVAAQGQFPAELLPQGPQTAGEEAQQAWLIGDLTLLEATEKFECRGQVLSLATWLRSPRRTLNEKRVRNQIRILRGEQVAARGWYQQLEPKHQVLVAGCLLFERLYDDQLFAVLDIAVEQVWRPRQPQLEAFDYQDLDALDAYFSTLTTETGAAQVGVTAEGMNRDLLTTVWELSRRLLLVCLPLISELVQEAGRQGWRTRLRFGGGLTPGRFAAKQPRPRPEPSAAPSVVPGAEDQDEGADEPDSGAAASSAPLSRFVGFGPLRELFASAQRRQRFCEVASDSLGRLGLLSPAAVERCLFELAAHNSWEAQAVVARALESWQDTERAEDLFRILREWYEEALRQERLLAAKESTKERRRQGSVRATLGLVVVFAALRAVSGELPDVYLRFTRRLAVDPSQTVRTRLRVEILPALVRWHQAHSDSLLRELASHGDLSQVIAFTWAQEHAFRPEETAKLLETWFEDGQRGGVWRIGLLGTVALTYGHLDYARRSCRVPISLAMTRLRGLLRDPDPTLRRRVFQAIGLLLAQSFETLRSVFPELVEELPLVDRGEILGPLLELYTDQRANLSGGDAQLEVDGRFFAVWASSGRPLTAVEAALEGWVADESHAPAQQLSFAALCAFRGSPLGLAEARWRAQPQASGWSAPVALGGELPAGSGPALREAPVMAWWILRWLTRGNPVLREEAWWLAPEALAVAAKEPWPVRVVLTIWQRRQEGLAPIGKLLSRFLVWYGNRGCLVLAAFLLFALLLSLAALLVK